MDDPLYEDLGGPTESTAKEREMKLYKVYKILKTQPQPCDQVLNLYQLNIDKSNKVFKTPANECER